MSIKEVTLPRVGEVVLLPSGEDGLYARAGGGGDFVFGRSRSSRIARRSSSNAASRDMLYKYPLDAPLWTKILGGRQLSTVNSPGDWWSVARG